MNYIYRKQNDQNIYQVGTNKVLSPTEFGNGAGYQELKAIDGAKYNNKALQDANYSNITQIGNSLYGLEKTQPVINQEPKQQGNVVDARVMNLGVQSGGTSDIALGTSEQAQKSYLDGALKANADNSAEIQQNLLKAQQLKEAEQNRIQAEAKLEATQNQRQAEVTNFDTQNNPITEAVRTSRTNALTALNDVYTSDKFKSDLLEQEKIVNDIKDLGDLAQKSITEANSGGATLNSIRQGRIGAIKEVYSSAMDLKTGYLKALQGKLDTAKEYLNWGADTLTQGYNDRINFLNSVNNFYSAKISNEKSNVDTLKEEEKTLISRAITDLEAKKTAVNATKSAIEKIMVENPSVANGAKLSLTDSPEQITTKLNDFYTKNPQYLPENQDWIKKSRDKYYDAGITLNDSIETVKSKILMSKIFEKENSGKFTQVTDSSGNTRILDTSTGTYKDANATNLGEQVGTISGLPSYNTLQSNPGKNRSDRNNNPGNIKVSSNTKNYPGVIGVESTPAQDGGNFLIFDNAQSGINAIGQLLMTNGYSNLTAEQAIKRYNGGGAYGAKDLGLDPNKDFQRQISDPNVRNKVATAIAKAEGFTGATQTINNGNNATIDALALGYIKNGSKIENIKGKNDVETAAIKESYLRQKSEGVKQDINPENTKQNAFLANLATEILTDKGKNSAVGINSLARGKIFGIPYGADYYTGANANFIGKVQQLADSLTLSKLIEVKGQGATFGALSDSERAVIERAATPINQWAIKDKNGKVVGYKIDENSFNKEMERIRTEYANKVLSTNNSNSLEQNLSANPTKIDEYNKLVKDNPTLSEDEINQLLGF